MVTPIFIIEERLNTVPSAGTLTTNHFFSYTASFCFEEYPLINKTSTDKIFTIKTSTVDSGRDYGISDLLINFVDGLNEEEFEGGRMPSFKSIG
ncbi:hypothetical protein O9929_17575 [Vibrio lentus]|nr:hypothetical protein [Vibrio lentus]